MVLSLVLAYAAQAQAPDSLLMVRYRAAEQLLRSGQYQQALPLLESLYRERPDVYIFYDRLKQTYENLKRYDDAIRLIEARLDDQAPNPSLLAEKGRLLYLKGNETAARAAWEAAIQAAPRKSGTYRVVYQTLLALRRFDEAIRVLERAQQALSNPSLFLLDLAYLYSLNGRYQEAMEAYRRFLEQDARRLGLVQTRLEPFLEEPAAREAGINVFKRAVRRTPLNPAFRQMLAWLYLRNDNYNEALKVYRALDRLQQAQGQLLLQFALQARDAGALEVARAALEEILRQAGSPILPEAHYELGRLYEQQARAGDTTAAQHARMMYQRFLTTFPGHPLFPDVLHRLARLELDVLHHSHHADSLLAVVIRRFGGHEVAWQARFDQGRLALQNGNLSAARLAFLRLLETRRTGPLAEAARYQLALLDFYEGAFEAALAQLDILVEDAASDIANDALSLRLLIQENRGPDSLHTPLRRYAYARLLLAQGQLAAALDSLNALQQNVGLHPIADDVTLLRAHLLRQLGRPAEALALLLEFPLRYPQSPLRDQSLYEAARIQEEDLHNPAAALKTYTRLLTEFPGSPLIPEVRLRIRTLREQDA
ncbi:tetratricopeptide repeat protein [Rhodothermus profundi]|uniref:tetratricopeptide repeat protein n=1 Tax=Rhodothermus profundi TaxID=633813 RepID=UPI001FE7E04D|nr:tetratricopeptide repeat protein [Rhodothermus profundi]